MLQKRKERATINESNEATINEYEATEYACRSSHFTTEILTTPRGPHPMEDWARRATLELDGDGEGNKPTEQQRVHAERLLNQALEAVNMLEAYMGHIAEYTF